MRKSVAVVLWIAIAALIVGDVVAIQVIDDRDDFPSAWDPRIAPLARIVEVERDLRFDHPVPVEFLGEDDYKKQISSDSDLTDEERREIETFEAQARALGLISSDTSILDDVNTIAAEGTLAYYDPSEEKMVIRGTEMTVGRRVTIVHELTHVLQDQAFDLEREFDTDGADSFFHALAEGDATRIENKYLESLNDEEQQAYENESGASDEAQDRLAGVAPALLTFFGAPYLLGEQVTSLVVEAAGVGELDDMFREPPDSDEGLIDPYAAIENERTVRVRRPTLRDGEKRTDSGDFGSVAWFVVLASFVDAKTALRAVDGWGGDSYVGYTKGAQGCIRVAFVGDTPNDTAEMAAALNQWKTPFTEGTVQVTADNERLELDTCEPRVVPTPRSDARVALSAPVGRLAILLGILEETGNRNLAVCYSNHFIADVPLDLLSVDEPTAAQQRQVDALGERIARGCVSGQLK